jgi:hypothetical protein
MRYYQYISDSKVDMLLPQIPLKAKQKITSEIGFDIKILSGKIKTERDSLDDVAQIAVPPENRAEHVVKFVEWHLIGDRDQADDHGAHLAQNRSHDQAFEGGCFNHFSRLLGSPDPRLFGALAV